MAFPWSAAVGLLGSLFGGGTKTPSGSGPVALRNAPSPLTSPHGFLSMSTRPIENQADYDLAIQTLSAAPDTNEGIRQAVAGLRGNGQGSAADLIEHAVSSIAQPLMGTDSTANDLKSSDVIRHLRNPFLMRFGQEGASMQDEIRTALRRPGPAGQALADIGAQDRANLLPRGNFGPEPFTVGAAPFEALREEAKGLRPMREAGAPLSRPAGLDILAGRPQATPQAQVPSFTAPQSRIQPQRPVPGAAADPTSGGFAQAQQTVDRIRSGAFGSKDIMEVMKRIYGGTSI